MVPDVWWGLREQGPGVDFRSLLGKGSVRKAAASWEVVAERSASHGWGGEEASQLAVPMRLMCSEGRSRGVAGVLSAADIGQDFPGSSGRRACGSGIGA